jgi:predicted DNA binding CopG/RHH family protein
MGAQSLQIKAAKNGLPLNGYIQKVLEEITNDE